MIGGVLLSSIFSALGLVVSWSLDLPAGAVVVVIAGGVFLGMAGLRMFLTWLGARGSGQRSGKLV